MSHTAFDTLLIHGGIDGGVVLGTDAVGILVECEPLGTVLNRVGVSRGTEVHHGQIDVVVVPSVNPVKPLQSLNV